MSEKNDIELVKSTIASKISYYRQKRDLSMRSLAKLVGVGEKMIRRWESGNYDFVPSISSLVKVANALDVNITKLLKS